MKRARHISVELPPCATASMPIWRQLMESMAWQIDIGRLAPGSVLPSTRTLAKQLGLSRTTVQAAYDELYCLGYLRGRVGDGSYVSARDARVRPPVHERIRTAFGDPDGLLLVLYSPFNL